MADLTAIYNEADKLKDQGKHEEAIARLEELLTVDANYTLAHLALAVLYGRVGQHERAVEHGRRACDLEPQEAFNLTALSVTYQRAFAGTGNRDYIRLAEETMAQAGALQQRQRLS